MPNRTLKILTLGLWVISAILQTTVCAQAQEDDAAEMARKSQDPLAYSFYLKGQGYLQDYHDPESINLAAAMFEKALDKCPKCEHETQEALRDGEVFVCPACQSQFSVLLDEATGATALVEKEETSPFAAPLRGPRFPGPGRRQLRFRQGSFDAPILHAALVPRASGDHDRGVVPAEGQ